MHPSHPSLPETEVDSNLECDCLLSLSDEYFWSALFKHASGPPFHPVMTYNSPLPFYQAILKREQSDCDLKELESKVEFAQNSQASSKTEN